MKKTMASNFPIQNTRQINRRRRKRENGTMALHNNGSSGIRTLSPSSFPNVSSNSTDNNVQNNNVNNTRSIERTYSSGIESCVDEDETEEIPIQQSRLRILPPIDSNTQIQRSSHLLRQQTQGINTNVVIQSQISKESLDVFHILPSILSREGGFLEKPNALPPISSSDGVPDHINKGLQNSVLGKRQEEIERTEPRKRAKTHTVYREIKRGDSWELIKAEKIRCVELTKHQEKMAKERQQQQKAAKKQKKHADKQRKTKLNKSKTKHDVAAQGDTSED